MMPIDGHKLTAAEAGKVAAIERRLLLLRCEPLCLMQTSAERIANAAAIAKERASLAELLGAAR
mgnify:FL=1